MHLALVPSDPPPPFTAPVARIHSHFPERAETTWSLPAIARLLGCHMRSARWQARYVEQLIANAHFPRPLPTMKGGELVKDILPTRSRWLPAAVTAWIGGQLPVEALDAADAQDAAQAASRLDAAAETLFGGDAA